MLIQGDKDVNLKPNQATLLDGALTMAGHGDHTLIMHEGSSHFWKGANEMNRDANMYAFFDQKLIIGQNKLKYRNEVNQLLCCFSNRRTTQLNCAKVNFLSMTKY